MKYGEREFLRYNDKLTIVWCVSRKCNFNCAYCLRPDTVHTPKSIDDITCDPYSDSETKKELEMLALEEFLELL